MPFIVLPLLTNYLNKESIGLYVLYQSILEFLLPILTLSIANSFLINYYKINGDEFKIYFSNGLRLLGIGYVILYFILYLCSDFVALKISFPSKWILITGIIVFFRFFNQVRLDLFRFNFKIRLYGIYTLSLSILNNVLGLYFVFNTYLGWTGMILGHLIGNSIISIISIISFWKEGLIVSVVNKGYIRDISKISIPIVFHRFGIWLSSAANKMIISILLGVAATASFGIGFIFATIVTVLGDALSKAFIPHIYKKLENKDNKRGIVKITYFIYLILIIFTMFSYGIGILAINYYFGIDYIDCLDFILPLVLAAMVKSFYSLHVSYIFYTKQTKRVTQITFTSGLISVILSYFMIKSLGLVGAAYSILIINIIQYIYTFNIGNRLVPMPWLLFVKNKQY